MSETDLEKAKAKFDKAMQQWDAMTDRQRIEYLRRSAGYLRTLEPGPADEAVMTAEEWADAFDDEADCIERMEDGELAEEESPAQLLAEAETARQILDLLKRYDAGSLPELIKRYK